jgi:hypothetical protein
MDRYWWIAKGMLRHMALESWVLPFSLRRPVEWHQVSHSFVIRLYSIPDLRQCLKILSLSSFRDWPTDFFTPLTNDGLVRYRVLVLPLPVRPTYTLHFLSVNRPFPRFTQRSSSPIL